MPAAATTEAAAMSLAAFLLVDLLPCSFLQTQTHTHPRLSHQRTGQTVISAAGAEHTTDGDEQQHEILCTYRRSLQGSFVHNEKADFSFTNMPTFV